MLFTNNIFTAIKKKNHKIVYDPDFKGLVAKILFYNPDFKPEKLYKAYTLAKEAHGKAKRASGEFYLNHPVKTAEILTELKVDEVTLIAALLHDVVEDSNIPLKKIEEEFGTQVARLVDGVTKLSKVQFKEKLAERQVVSLQKMFLVMAEDLRVILIKLADRLHNIGTLRHFRPDKVVRIAKETLEIYVPLANLLGVWTIQQKLENECYKYLYPKEYQKIVELVKKYYPEREKIVKEMVNIFRKEFKKRHLKAEIIGRSKHINSIFKKIHFRHKRLEDIFDIHGIRIIVDEELDCYKALGVVHKLFIPKVNRFKDFIAQPKANGYKSLHTTVYGIKRKLTEVQIRTKEMDREASFGVAAHFIYSSHSKHGDFKDAALSHSVWIRKILALQISETDLSKYLESLKLDFLHDRIYIFTPRGQIINLPMGAVALDFAYQVHTDLGNYAKYAIVNGLKAELTQVLQTGDTVEIVPDKEGKSKPKRDWLHYVKTNDAKNKIKNWFKKEGAEVNIKKGRELVKKYLTWFDLPKIVNVEHDVGNKFLQKFEIQSWDYVFENIGKHKIQLQDFFSELLMYTKSFGKLVVTKEKSKLYKIVLNIEAVSGTKSLNQIFDILSETNIKVDIFQANTLTNSEIGHYNLEISIRSFKNLVSALEKLEKTKIIHNMRVTTK